MVREVSSNSGEIPSLFQMERIADERLKIAQEAQGLCRRALQGFDTLASAIHDLEKKADKLLERANQAVENGKENERKYMESEMSMKKYAVENSDEKYTQQNERIAVRDHHSNHEKTKKLKQAVVEKELTIFQKIILWIKTFFS